MDSGTMIIVVASIFAIVAVAGFFYYRQSGETEIKLPFGMSIKISGSNAKQPPNPGISAKEIKSREGGLLAEETTGRGIEVEKVDVKDDVLLSSSRPLAKDQVQNRNSQFPNTLSAQALSAGGDITIQQFVGSQVSLAQQLEFFAGNIGLENIRASNFANSQFKAYSDVWKSLQALRLAGDDLWNQASVENFFVFTEQLRKTTTVVREGEIFFEDDDRERLTDILKQFGRYRMGKNRLINIRSKGDLFEEYPYTDEHEKEYLDKLIKESIQEQVNRNRQIKIEYERLLDTIRISFKTRLSKFQ